MKSENLTIKDVGQGYVFDPESGSYSCIVCGTIFENGEIYQIEGRFFEAARAAENHMQQEHGDYLHRLIDSNSKYNTFTETHKQLLHLFAADISDKDIAKELGISPSTVRHQKFMFREKAKQARQYLAVYERVFENKAANADAIISIHDNAKMVDERYVVTPDERGRILQTYFANLIPLKLKTFPSKEKKKVVVLSQIAGQFQQGKIYSEKEINEALRAVYGDFATLRRYLIEYGFMKREKDCTQYRLT